jgi:hypothetical protein
LPAAAAGETRFALSADFMLLDEGGTRAKDGRKGEEETSDERSVAAAEQAGEYGRSAPSAKRIRYSYQRPSLRDDGEKRIGVMPDLR